MSEAEKLLRRLGGVRIPAKRHKVYLLAGVRFTLHSGSKADPVELKATRQQLRRMGLLDHAGRTTS